MNAKTVHSMDSTLLSSPDLISIIKLDSIHENEGLIAV